MENNIGFIYLLSNPAMPGLIKIGITYAEDVKSRMNQLYNTSVPFPFEVAYAAKVNQPEKVEAALHIAFGPHRVNPKREFFEIDSFQAISIIKLLEISDATKEVEFEKNQLEVDKAEIEAGKEYTRKRPRLNFIEMGIPIGSELISTKNQESAVVITDRLINFRGEETSLTNATKIILGNEYSVAPGPYWTFNGKKLTDIYNLTYLVKE